MKVLVLFWLVSCAAGSIVVKETDLKPYKDSAQVTKSDSGRTSIEIESVRDLRASKDTGFGYTGVKYHKTPITLENPVETFVQDYITDQLELRNIEVLAGAATKLEISIVTFQVYELIEKFKPERAKCELQLEFKMRNNTKYWDGNYSENYLSAGDLTDGTKRLAPTLASCMNSLMEKLIHDDTFMDFLRN